MTDQVFFEKSFNQQMVDICFEVEEIIRSGAKETIKAMGRKNYGKSDTAVVVRLFDLTRADPKNFALMREILRAEKEFTDFLYDAPGACPEDEILAYWRGFKDSSLAEAEQHSPYYFLMRGHKDWNHDNDQWIGIYRTLSVLKDEYFRAKDKLEKEKSSAVTDFGTSYSKALSEESVIIHAFDEVEGKWYYDIKPESLFDSKHTDHKEIEIEVALDAEIMYLWRLYFAKKDFTGYSCENCTPGGRRNGEESIFVKFDVKNSYEILDYFEGFFGDFNLCPSADTMREKARVFQERYSAELVGISHDGLRFKCGKKLTSENAEEIIAESAALHAEITDCKPEKIKEYIINKGEFTLWWD